MEERKAGAIVTKYWFGKPEAGSSILSESTIFVENSIHLADEFQQEATITRSESADVE